MAEPQNYRNHVRVDKAYLALMVLNVTLIVTALVSGGLHYRLLNWLLLGLAVAVTSATIAARGYGLRNQDRIIRLEEHLRLRRLGHDPDSLDLRQLIALRFAADAEVVALAERARREKMPPKEIKAAIVQWRPDHHRV